MPTHRCQGLLQFPIGVAAALLTLANIATEAADSQSPKDLPTAVHSFLEEHCLDCHDEDSRKGDLDLSKIAFGLTGSTSRLKWVHIHDRIKQGEMPPDSGDLPAADRSRFIQTLGTRLHDADRTDVLTNGRGPLRRMTRVEYENSLRDLLKLPDLDVRDKLPADRDAHGFTKVSRLLDMSRVQLAAYLDAAEAALTAAVATGMKPPPAKNRRFTGTDLFPALTTFGEREAMFFARAGRMVPISNAQLQKMTPEQRRDETLELALFRSATWPYYGYPRGFRAEHDGAYQVRFSGRAVRQMRDYRIVPAYDPLPMSFRARQPSGPDVSGDVRETGGWLDLEPELKVFETTIRLKKGETFEYSLLGLPVPFIRTDNGFFYDYPPMPRDGHRGAAFQWLEVDGPIAPTTWPPPSHRVLFEDLPIRPAAKGSRFGIEVVSKDPATDAPRLFRSFARRAACQPVPDRAIKIYLKLISAKLKDGAPFVEAMLKGYQAFLCSGHVLYLTEPGKAPAGQYAIAARLSHLLLNTDPDARLRQLAKDGQLGAPKTLITEAARLINSPGFERFVADFTDQWLDLRELRRDVPDNRLYPEYRKDDYLVASMENETRTFFRTMVRDNLSATTLVDADFTFVNDRLARHYDLPRAKGSGMRRIKLPKWSPYGGLLTQASVLKLTANGTTTSPVLRGAWVMEKLLGDPPPPPPKSVPAIEPDIRGATTVRALLAKHTKSKSCAACHARFDPVGFALENFDVMGAWRDRYRGLEKGEKVTGIDPAGHPYIYHVGAPVESAGKLLDGRRFENIRELKSLLASNPRPLARNLLHQFTLYATGTPVRFSDRREIEAILDHIKAGGYRVRDLLYGLIGSRIFLGQPD
jgi:mono/diheme cytochrome c family protein